MLAVRRDKQTGVGPAVAPVFPPMRHPCCQAHALRHLAAPLAAADAACKGERRQAVRPQVGTLIRQEPRRPHGHAGGLTVTGLLPSPVADPTGPACPRPTPSAAPTASAPDAEQSITQCVRHTRSLLTLKGRPPFRLAERETDERLSHVTGLRRAWLATR